MKFILSIFLLLTGCVTNQPKPQNNEKLNYNHIEYYQREFAKSSNGKYTLKKVKSVPIYIVPYRKFNNQTKEWVDMYSGPVGTCYPFGIFNIITINSFWWYANFNELDRKQLIFHELGHCLLKRSHTHPTSADDIGGMWERLLFDVGIFVEQDRYLKDMCPISYMDPELLTTKCIKKHDQYYMDELFGRTTREQYENEYRLSN